MSESKVTFKKSFVIFDEDRERYYGTYRVDDYFTKEIKDANKYNSEEEAVESLIKDTEYSSIAESIERFSIKPIYYKD